MNEFVTLEQLGFMLVVLSAGIIFQGWLADHRNHVINGRLAGLTRYAESLEAELGELRANLEWEMGRGLRHDVPHVREGRHAE